ncbi:regulator of chromosome condensation 1/beta-lactamase-inhibitor protein II [Microdochium trichocladiopsis]|uniref:Regulator of chromosome condensation 1/beta-lactamase-inhibitor protein II n=1 Tax=Microdochium trichocladiopsis TaxID=1682393 RepID=A0A9P9BUY5_9PEZI|nr:regulator of chromosome condensation 1/beta-lactamase-inhibitor protein II [Microdochium trichocladiopsis]KAH7041471.1 regulator of chromosome condensation 1/beta-lactamase-inhibitor protein II [Microdochium trichocladiopsis]
MEGLFALGSNGSGQLGIGHLEDVSVPKQVEFDPSDWAPTAEDPVCKIAAGGNHTILLTTSGRTYWSGDAKNGCAGQLDSTISPTSARFRPVTLSDKAEMQPRVSLIACMWACSIFVTTEEQGEAQKVYTFGETVGTPTLLENFPPSGTTITDLDASFRHAVFVLSNGEVYGYGTGTKGQLGPMNDLPRAITSVPRKISGVNFEVSRAVCSQFATCFISEPGDGRVLVLGADKWDLVTSAPVAVPDWKAISASWGNFYILKYGGTIVAWGRNDHGQLPPPDHPSITDIAAGSEHCLAQTTEGDVLAWGWGEHGNCGPSTDGPTGNVSGRWNTLASLSHLPATSRFTLIGAGCATSWINIATDGLFI